MRHSDDTGVILDPRERTQKLSEREHFEQLIASLKKFREHASQRGWDTGYLRDCVQHCAGIGFYRNDERWYTVAALLDEMAKRPPDQFELIGNVVNQIAGIIRSVEILMNQRRALH